MKSKVINLEQVIIINLTVNRLWQCTHWHSSLCAVRL